MLEIGCEIKTKSGLNRYSLHSIHKKSFKKFTFTIIMNVPVQQVYC